MEVLKCVADIVDEKLASIINGDGLRVYPVDGEVSQMKHWSTLSTAAKTHGSVTWKRCWQKWKWTNSKKLP